MRRKARSCKEKARFVSEYKSSGLSATAFSKKHDIPTSSLYLWLMKERQANPSIRMARVVRQPVKRPDAVARAGLVIESRALRVHVPVGVDRSTLETVLTVIASHASGGAS
jgi:transposase-like protein